MCRDHWPQHLICLSDQLFLGELNTITLNYSSLVRFSHSWLYCLDLCFSPIIKTCLEENTYVVNIQNKCSNCKYDQTRRSDRYGVWGCKMLVTCVPVTLRSPVKWKSAFGFIEKSKEEDHHRATAHHDSQTFKMCEQKTTWRAACVQMFFFYWALYAMNS